MTQKNLQKKEVFTEEYYMSKSKYHSFLFVTFGFVAILKYLAKRKL